MVYTHPTLPLKIGEPKISKDKNAALGLSPRDLEVMKEVAAKKGYKDHRDYFFKLHEESPSNWYAYALAQAKCKESPSSSECQRLKQSLMGVYGPKSFNKIEADYHQKNAEFDINAKLRGMEKEAFLDYAKKETEHREELCKCDYKKKLKDIMPYCDK